MPLTKLTEFTAIIMVIPKSFEPLNFPSIFEISQDQKFQNSSPTYSLIFHPHPISIYCLILK
jgi:hypothetical protein